MNDWNICPRPSCSLQYSGNWRIYSLSRCANCNKSTHANIFHLPVTEALKVQRLVTPNWQKIDVLLGKRANVGIAINVDHLENLETNCIWVKEAAQLYFPAIAIGIGHHCLKGGSKTMLFISYVRYISVQALTALPPWKGFKMRSIPRE